MLISSIILGIFSLPIVRNGMCFEVKIPVSSLITGEKSLQVGVSYFHSGNFFHFELSDPFYRMFYDGS